MEEKIYCQTDWQGFYIGTTVNNCAGAIDTDEPIFDKKTEKAKWDGTKWVIKSIIEWELKEGEILNGGVVEKIEKPSELHSWNYDTKEWFLDEEKARISKLPSQEEIERNKIELVALDLIMLMKEDGVI